ncbi:hypothetical protein AWF33_19385 [Escherichia coli]|nr:hypothetical protein P423_14320 [Escherichia coli JJ1886]EFH8996816.1 hypothetical protein [Escherichia coli]KUR97640.1 hypothetical protein AWE63_25265 [Escherichia coli]KUU89875.1 hypothetical protein AWF33_19385 [Escherichia coli]OJS54156.1 hypothetical protein BK405_25520 [Escherichia coli]
MVWKLDRLRRSMRHLVVLVEELRERGINFCNLTDSIDTQYLVNTNTWLQEGYYRYPISGYSA